MAQFHSTAIAQNRLQPWCDDALLQDSGACMAEVAEASLAPIKSPQGNEHVQICSPCPCQSLALMLLCLTQPGLGLCYALRAVCTALSLPRAHQIQSTRTSLNCDVRNFRLERGLGKLAHTMPLLSSCFESHVVLYMTPKASTPANAGNRPRLP